MNSQPQLNRSQRRAREKSAKRTATRMDQRQYHAYQARARLWSKGAIATGRHIGGLFESEWEFPAHVPADKRESVAQYATYAPMRWRVIARLVLRYDDGQETREADAECGQAQKIGELMELREQLMRELKASVNARYIWDSYYVMECLG